MKREAVDAALQRAAVILVRGELLLEVLDDHFRDDPARVPVLLLLKSILREAFKLRGDLRYGDVRLSTEKIRELWAAHVLRHDDPSLKWSEIPARIGSACQSRSLERECLEYRSALEVLWDLQAERGRDTVESWFDRPDFARFFAWLNDVHALPASTIAWLFDDPAPM